MLKNDSWNGPNKVIARRKVYDPWDWVAAYCALFITAKGFADVKLALKLGVIDKNTFVILVNDCKEQDICKEMNTFAKKHFNHYHIHDKKLQEKMFKVLGFSDEEARDQFGFLMNAFEYGAPPHGGIAFGFDRWCSLFGGSESIRDYIAFPKNNAARDVMIDSPSKVSAQQLEELYLNLVQKED